MMSDALVARLNQVLDERMQVGNPVQFWLRDDDAVEPSEPLDQLLALTSTYQIPVTLALIPAFTGKPLAQHLEGTSQVAVAVHGWSHANHALPAEKKQELGGHRPVAEILEQLSRGFSRLAGLHGLRFVPLLVPPWNRIAPVVVERLLDLGFEGLSTFGVPEPVSIRMINTHVDLIDWKGSRGGRVHDVLLAEIIEQIQTTSNPIGLLTHHLVHDTMAWRFLEQFFAITVDHAGCTWAPVNEFLPVSA